MSAPIPLTSLVAALTTHLQLLKTQYNNANNITKALNTVTFKGTTYQSWLDKVNDALGLHVADVLAHQDNASKISAYSHGDLDSFLDGSRLRGVIPVSLVTNGDSKQLLRNNQPENFAAIASGNYVTSKFLDYDLSTFTFTINVSHLLLNGIYKQITTAVSGSIETTSNVGDALVVSSTLSDYLLNTLAANTSVNIQCYLIRKYGNITLYLQKSDEARLAESDNVFWVSDGVLGQDGSGNNISGLTGTWSMRIGLYRINPNDSTIYGSTIPWTPIALSLLIGPGPQSLVGGNSYTGFYGEATPTDLITGTDLASTIGLTAGVNAADIDDIPWLKFNLNQKTLFVAKRNFRSMISWDDISNANAVDGSQTITIRIYQFKVRLLKGVRSDTEGVSWSQGFDTEITWGSEWNRLIYNILPAVSGYPQTSQVGSDWANYDPADIDGLSGSGIWTSWCQEVYPDPTLNRVYRGNYSLTYLGSDKETTADTWVGWRPVLELDGVIDTGPGPQTFIGETPEDNKGFFGEVPSSDLITGTALSTLVNLTAGTNATNVDNIPWLKFFIDDTVIFVAKRHFKNTISWNDLNAAGLIDGSQTVIIGNYQYKIRLMKGIRPDPDGITWSQGYDTEITWGSEWNRLIYNILPAFSASFPQDSQVGDDWVSYNSSDIDADTGGNTSLSICQEYWDSGPNVTSRGGISLSICQSAPVSATQLKYGWRPVLELIGPAPTETEETESSEFGSSEFGSTEFGS